jgi:hypothetical protein
MEMRLVLVQFGIEARWTTWALLYPAQVTPFTTALASFRVREDQELPAVAPGRLVEVSGHVAVGSTDVGVHAGGVVLRPDGPLSGRHRLGFAEARGSRAIVRPELEQTLSPFARAGYGSDGLTRAHWEMRRWAGQYRVSAVPWVTLALVWVGLEV